MNTSLMALSLLLLVACVVLVVKTFSSIGSIEDLRSQKQPVEIEDFHNYRE